MESSHEHAEEKGSVEDALPWLQNTVTEEKQTDQENNYNYMYCNFIDIRWEIQITCC